MYMSFHNKHWKTPECLFFLLERSAPFCLIQFKTLKQTEDIRIRMGWLHWAGDYMDNSHLNKVMTHFEVNVYWFHSKSIGPLKDKLKGISTLRSWVFGLLNRGTLTPHRQWKCITIHQSLRGNGLTASASSVSTFSVNVPRDLCRGDMPVHFSSYNLQVIREASPPPVYLGLGSYLCGSFSPAPLVSPQPQPHPPTTLSRSAGGVINLPLPQRHDWRHGY